MITVIMHFAKKKSLTLDEYTSIDVQRTGKNIYVNATNTKEDMAFNTLFDKILNYLGGSDTFSITIKKESGSAEFENMTVSYHLTGQAEVLSLTQKQEEQTQQEAK